MKLDDIKSVLTFQAFRPDADDSNAPIPKRLQGKKFVCINISRGRVTWRAVDRKGQYGPGGVLEGEFQEVAGKMAEEWRGHTDGGWTVVSLNNRFIVTLENNMSRKPGSEKTIRTNAKSVIGTKYDRGKRYAIHHNPETSASILLACDESMVKAVEEALYENGLKAARISCGLFAMVEDYLRREHDARKGGPGRDFVLLACCDGSVCVLAQKKGQWSELRSRVGVYSEADIEPVMNIAAPLINGAAPSTPIVLMHDQPSTSFAQTLYQRLASLGAVDVTQPEHIWMVLGQN